MKQMFSNQQAENLDPQDNLVAISKRGFRWNVKALEQSKSIGEGEDGGNVFDYAITGELMGRDYTNTDYIAYEDKEYIQRRDFLRKFAKNGEIEYVLDTIADEVVTYNEKNFFAVCDTGMIDNIIKKDKAEEVKKYIDKSFKNIYNAYGFQTGHDGWHYLRKFLIDGFLCFETVFDTSPTNDAKDIILFKEIDPVTIVPRIQQSEGGDYIRVWVQYEGDNTKQRILSDESIVYISWARGNFESRISYVERLVKPFNTVRTIENSRMIWNLQNAQKRVKITVPIGSQSEAKARTRLQELYAQYKEDIVIDSDSGDISVNGQPNFPFSKTFVLPAPETGGNIDIGEIANEGYNLSDVEQLKYYWRRFILETKVPKTRFSFVGDDTSAKLFEPSDGSLSYEEISFDNYITRIRSIYKEILLKPLWTQLCIKYPQFIGDERLKVAIGVKYTDNDVFIRAKLRQIISAGATTVSTLSNIMKSVPGPDGQPIQTPFFNLNFLVTKFMDFTPEDIAENERLNKEDIEKQQAQASATQQSADGDSGMDMGGMDMGGMDMGGMDMGGMGDEPAPPPEPPAPTE